jgi:hypothetical protein
MSSRNARRRRRAPQGALRSTAARPATVTPRSQPAAKAPRLDPLALYRRSTFVGRVPRLGLLVGLLCLDGFGIMRLVSGKQSTFLSSMGTGLVLGFIVLSWIGYLRVIYTVRRQDPEAWRTSRGFLLALMGAPLGVGDPDANAYDRVVFWLTVLATVVLLPLSFVHNS